MQPDIEAEFWRAIRFAKAAQARGLDWPFSPRVQWGIASVQFYGIDRKWYEPQQGAVLAFIVPVVEHGELIDLCAINSANNHCGQRLGLGHGLGLDAVEKSRFGCCDLLLVERPMDWMCEPLVSNPNTKRPIEPIYLFNLASVGMVLDGVREFVCTHVALAERVQSLLPPSQHDRVGLYDG